MRWILIVTCVLALSCSRGNAPGEDGQNAMAGTSAGGPAGANASAGSTAASGGAVPAGGAATQGGSAGSAADFAELANDTASGVFVHLFEWRWPDIARECETFLGPQGFTAVQVSPPSEHALLPSNGYPWWQRYQTVSYALESRSGTRQEFADMVARCRAAGVGIYVDAVLNHMTAQTSGLGSAGSKFTKYAYPDLYAAGDFHTPICQIQGADYATSAEHVQRCELVGLADLDTGSESVQAKLAAYLSETVALGVRGFRIDAAKHVAAAEVAAILAKVVPAHGEQPYYFLEVIDPGGEAVLASDYLEVGGDRLDVTEFRYAGVGDAFLGRYGKTLASLRELSEASWSLLPADRSVVFVANHDTQRADAPFFQDGPAHDLATVFMLAFPYGYPSVMSSYGFDRETGSGRDQGPPSDGTGHTRPVYAVDQSFAKLRRAAFHGCYTGLDICEHRARYVSGMVGFRKVAAGAPVENFWDNGLNQLAFSRGALAFVAINHEQAPLDQTLQTGLPEGEYCNVLSEDFTAAAGGSPAVCGAAAVHVDSSGMATLSLPPEYSPRSPHRRTALGTPLQRSLEAHRVWGWGPKRPRGSRPDRHATAA